MTRYPFPKETDKSLYRDALSNNAYYGLPQPVSFCKLCVISNQRPSSTIEFKNNGTKPKTVIQFSKDEICDACRANKQKSAIISRNRTALEKKTPSPILATGSVNNRWWTQYGLRGTSSLSVASLGK